MLDVKLGHIREAASVAQQDAILVQLAQQGSPTALVEIYERHYHAIYTYIYCRVADRPTAEDLTADVFVRVVDKIHTFVPGDKPLLAWLYTIAANRLVDHYRRAGRVHWVPLTETARATDGDPVQQSQSLSTQTNIWQALARLTEEQRLVIVLKFVEGRSNAEAAMVLGKNEGAIKALQHRALAALRRWLSTEVAYEPT